MHCLGRESKAGSVIGGLNGWQFVGVVLGAFVATVLLLGYYESRNPGSKS